jgi:hypothetical protein
MAMTFPASLPGIPALAEQQLEGSDFLDGVPLDIQEVISFSKEVSTSKVQFNWRSRLWQSHIYNLDLLLRAAQWWHNRYGWWGFTKVRIWFVSKLAWPKLLENLRIKGCQKIVDWLTAQGSQKVKQLLAGAQQGRPLDSLAANMDSNSSNEAQDRNPLASLTEPSQPNMETRKRKANEIEYEVEAILQHRWIHEVIFDRCDILNVERNHY